MGEVVALQFGVGMGRKLTRTERGATKVIGAPKWRWFVRLVCIFLVTSPAPMTWALLL